MLLVDDVVLDDGIKIVLPEFVVACNLDGLFGFDIHHHRLRHLQQQFLGGLGSKANVACAILIDDIFLDDLQLFLG
jgi:hypothetical protein